MRTGGHEQVLRGVTVLNVNDRLAARYVVTKMLQAAGCRVLEANSGEEALRIARESRPAVALLDIQLPDIDGLEVCRRLKADPATQAISVIQTSATYNTPDMKVRGLAGGADSYLMQPFGSAELVAAIDAMVHPRGADGSPPN